MPQYRVGHRERVQRIRTLAAAQPGLFLTGNGYDGMGIPDCIHQARETATQMLDLIAQPSTVHQEQRP